MIVVDGYDGASGQVVLTLAYERPVLTAPEVLGGLVRFELKAPARTVATVEASEDLRTWVPLETNQVPDVGVLQVIDSHPVGLAWRFYRAFTK